MALRVTEDELRELLVTRLEVDDHLRSLVMDRRDAASIRTTAVQKGMKTLFQDGRAKVFLGETTMDEVLRVAP